MKSELTRRELVESPDRHEPHVVILGAGASKAALPDGDANGRLIPLMDELPEILGDPWQTLVEDAKLEGVSFETQMTLLYENKAFRSCLTAIENMLSEYFSSLALPDHPTVYDCLILGLREKDVIATFNWDPFLMLAHARNRAAARLPDIRFLHGCVQYASCPDHDVCGQPGEQCPKCRKPLRRSSIVFPYGDKDYGQDGTIARDWTFVTERLERAFHLTIFGYSGPESDYKARMLLLDGWKQTPWRKFSHVEIIDTAKVDDLRRNWKNFIPFHHVMVSKCFRDSTIARWPRRTIEYKAAASLHGTVSERIGPITARSLKELQELYAEIADMESY